MLEYGMDRTPAERLMRPPRTLYANGGVAGEDIPRRVSERGAGISEKLAKSAESSTLAVLNETENEDEALVNYGKMQDLALEAGLTMDEVYRTINIGNERAKQSFLDEGGSRFTIAKKFLPFTKAWKYSAKIRATEKGFEILANFIEKEIDDTSDKIESFFEDVEEGYGNFLGIGKGIDNTLQGRGPIAEAFRTGEQLEEPRGRSLLGTGLKPRGSITPERAAFRDKAKKARGLALPQ
jgi:hypothetical protein